jgi:TonB-linked SusC/RagA family outer membrane protein
VQLTFAQEKTVTGTVVDGDGLPIPGVNVIIKNTSTGTQTDFDGNYTIQASSSNVLVFDYVGMKTVEVRVGAKTNINVTMKADVEALDEVVVTGYKSTTTKKSTNSIQTISAEKVESRPAASVVTALQGQVAGLNIGTGSGQPGANSFVILRGAGSINGNIEPLFIVDGVPVDEDNFRSINQNDIESISVLKDGSASALYGSRGANGAIVITTKKGAYGTGLKINYRSQYGFSELPDDNFSMMTSRQRLEFERANNISTAENWFGVPELTDNFIEGVVRQANTDWQEIFLDRSQTVSHNLSLSSGTENINSFTSFSFFEQDGVARRSNLKRFSFRNNLSGKTNNGKFTYGTNLTANYSKNSFIPAEGTGFLANPFIVPYVAMPYLSPFNADGSLNITGNGLDDFINTPYTSLNNTELNTNKDEEVKVIGSFNANWEFIDNVTAGIRFGLDYTQIKSTFIEDPQSIYGQATVASGNAQFQGTYNESYSTDTRFINLVSLGYENTFGEKHDFDITLFTEYNKSYLETSSINQVGLDPRLFEYGTGFVDGNTFEDLNENGQIDGDNEFPYIPDVNIGDAQVGLFSYFSVANYSYDSKYNVQASVRRDASSRFAESNRWGTFWSASGSWNVSDEKFMADGPFDLLKLRLSYGESGNDRIAETYYGARFNAFNTYSTGNGYNGTVGIFASNIANPELKWETVSQYNIGLDFAFLQNRLTGSIDAYDKQTDDLFTSIPVQALNGTTFISANTGVLSNKGVEANLRWRAINKEFKLSLFANGSYNKNEIVELPNGEDIEFGARTRLREGKEFREFFVVEWAGVNPANGQNLYVDANGDLTETFNEADRKFIDKSPLPTWQGGFGFNSSYKGFSLDAQFSWVADIYRNNGGYAVAEDPTLTGLSNSSVTLLDAWQQPGDITEIPALNTPSIRNLDTSRYIEDASFLRLRNIVFAYDLKQSVLKDSDIFSSIRLFVQGENLITWSKWRGWDPESSFREGDFFDFPTTKIVTFGLDLTF